MTKLEELTEVFLEEQNDKLLSEVEIYAVGLASGWISRDQEEFFRLTGMEPTKVIEILKNLAYRLDKQ